MITSAGIIPFRVNDQGELEFFVGHPGGNHNKFSDYWAFLKGCVEENEDEGEAAIREFKEETGLTMEDCPSDTLYYLGRTQQNKYKIVVAYALLYPNINPTECYSNLAEDGVTPEIDRYAWMTLDRLAPCTHPSHIQFYDEIKRIYNERIAPQQEIDR